MAIRTEALHFLPKLLLQHDASPEAVLEDVEVGGEGRSQHQGRLGATVDGINGTMQQH